MLRPYKHIDASGSINRKVLQALEKKSVLSKSLQRVVEESLKTVKEIWIVLPLKLWKKTNKRVVKNKKLRFLLILSLYYSIIV